MRIAEPPLCGIVISLASGDDNNSCHGSFHFSSASSEGKRNMRVTLIHNPKAGANEQPSAGRVPGVDHARRDTPSPANRPRATTGKRHSKTPAISWRWRGAMARSARSPSALPGGAFRSPSCRWERPTTSRRCSGWRTRPLEQLIAGWPTARRIAFDTGMVHGPWGATRFIEGFGVGLLAQSDHRARRQSRSGIWPGRQPRRKE